MEKTFSFLSSLKLAVALLVLLLVSLAAGTAVEAFTDAEAAGRFVYYSWWFIGLQALLAINVAMSLVSLFPWAKGRIGYAIAHASLVIVMLGAALTFFFKTDGMLMLWEGESGSVIVRQHKQGNVTLFHDLPFVVTLDDFVLDTYPGTQRPSGFASHVQIADKQGGHTFKAKIWMNNPLKYRGYTLFQSSYRQDGEREATVLAVSKDPGQIIVFTGFITLLLGLAWMLAERARPSKAAASALLLLMLAPSLLGQAPEPPATRLARLPVQHDGRVMPFDTFAREMVKTITGSSKWQGEEPVSTVMQWIDGAENAARAKNIKIGSSELAAALGYPAGTKHISFVQALENENLVHMLNMHDQSLMHGMPANKIIAAAVQLEKRLVSMRGILFGISIIPLPPSGHANGEWAEWGGQEEVSSKSLIALLDGPRLDGWPSEAKMNREIFYNKLNPVRLSWIIALCALVLSVFASLGSFKTPKGASEIFGARDAHVDHKTSCAATAAASTIVNCPLSIVHFSKFCNWLGLNKHRFLDIAAFTLLFGSFAMMTWGIVLRWQAGGRIPAANMYESMLFLAWGVGLFAVVAYGLVRSRFLVLNAAVMATLAMLLTDLLPLDHFIRPIAPVLAGTPWLAIHVPIIMVGYAVLALGLAAAHMQVGVWIFCPQRRDLAGRFYALLRWYNLVGSIFLLAGIITGSMWAASSWGRYWGWDPKEVWSLVAFLAYMAIAHAKVGGLIGKFGVAAWSILAFQTILMTYLGVNFVLTIGMHSYGMGDSPIAVWMLLIALAEIVFVGFGLFIYKKQTQDN